MTDDTAKPRPEDAATARPRTEPQGGQDLRGSDASAARDRSAHRRATWLYDDLLS